MLLQKYSVGSSPKGGLATKRPGRFSMKVKIFRTPPLEDFFNFEALEGQINKWLEELGPKAEVINQQTAFGGNVCVITIWYIHS